MNKVLSSVFLLTGVLYGYAQVGINNSSPAATLDVTAKASDGSRAEGMIPPRISGNALKAADTNNVYGSAQNGAIVYVTSAASTANQTGQAVNITSTGYYYFDSAINGWVKIGAGSGSGVAYSSGDGISIAGNVISANAATNSANGIMRLAGDLTGSAAAPVIGTGRINSSKIEDLSIQTSDLADNSVTTGKIVDGTILASDIANNAITVSKLPSGAGSTTFLRGDGTWAAAADNLGNHVATTHLRLSDNNIYLRTGSDTNHGLVYNSTADGPRLYGSGGGFLSGGSTNALRWYSSGNVDISGQIKISGGSPGSGKILTSDTNGLASWQTPVSAGDNLGNHVATTNLRLSDNNIYLRTGSDANHGLVYNSTADGPRLYGNSGGFLGAGSTNALRWYSNGNIDVAGQIKISGGNPGNGKILTSDANGIASWITSNSATKSTAVGTLPNTGPNIGNSNSTGAGPWTRIDGAAITLGPGRWLVNIGSTAKGGNSVITVDGQNRYIAALSTSSGSFNQVNSAGGTGSWVAGDQGRGSARSVITGTIAVENNSAGNVTYYLFGQLERWGSNTGLNWENAFGSDYLERWFYAIPIN